MLARRWIWQLEGTGDLGQASLGGAGIEPVGLEEKVNDTGKKKKKRTFAKYFAERFQVKIKFVVHCAQDARHC